LLLAVIGVRYIGPDGAAEGSNYFKDGKDGKKNVYWTSPPSLRQRLFVLSSRFYSMPLPPLFDMGPA